MENQKRLLLDEMHHLPSSRLLDDDLPDQLAAKFGMNVPVLEEEKKYGKRRPTEIDVSRNPMHQFLHGYGGPNYIHGTELSIYIPFSGDPELFNIRPSSFDYNPPRGETVGNELCLTFAFADALNPDEYERTINSIKKYLDWLRPSAHQLHNELRQQAQAMIAQRRNKEIQQVQTLDALGIRIVDDPVSGATAASSEVSPINEREKPRKPNASKWDVFVSHASEDKDEIARPLANALQAKGLSIWYDEFSLKLGDSLRQKIDYGLSQSRFGLVILSPHFFEKHWPQQELNGLATREVGGKKVILPVWHKLDFEQVRQYSPTLADKLAVSTEEGLDRIVQTIIEAIQI